MPSSENNHETEPLFEWLLKEIKQTVRSTNFFVSDDLPVSDVGLTIEGLGRVPIPLNQKLAESLISKCRAPDGKGTETLVDTNVRNTFELDPQYFSLGDEFNKAVNQSLQKIADALGLPSDRFEAQIYKLLVCEEGGFFVPHRDTEKLDRILASMIVVLPNRFFGGELIVRHGKSLHSSMFSSAKNEHCPCFAAFYADCLHKVEPVTEGVRLTLAYNLVLKPSQKSFVAVGTGTPEDRLAEAISARIADRKTKSLVFALEHHYTQHGLKLDLLKGADRQLVELLVSVAEKANCVVHLAQVERKLTRSGDIDEFDPDTPPEELEQLLLVDHYVERDKSMVSHWADLEGNPKNFKWINLDRRDLISSLPIEKWQPTDEQFLGVTGNSGTTVDRTYQRSALVMWHRDHEADALASEYDFYEGIE